MSQPIESDQTHEQLFESTKFTIKKHLLNSPLIPKGPRASLEDLLRNRTLMLPDDRYIELARRDGVSGIENYDGDSDDSFSDTRAIYLPGDLHGRDDLIIVRENMVAASLHNPDSILGGILEEVAHAYRPSPREVPLLSVSDNSLKVAPFRSREEIESFLNSSHESFKTSDRPVNLDDISVVSIGFLSHMIERAPHLSDPILHPHTSTQSGFEEARASAIQAIFGAKIQGSRLKPFGSLREQLAYGLDNMFDSREAIHQGQVAGLAIMYDLLARSPNIVEAAQEFIKKVYELDVDQFVEYLRSKSSLSFEGFFKIAAIFDGSKSGNSDDRENID